MTLRGNSDISAEQRAKQLASVANAARDLADSFARFDRDTRRAERVIAEAGGPGDPAVMRTIRTAINTPSRIRAWERMAEGARGAAGPES